MIVPEKVKKIKKKEPKIKPKYSLWQNTVKVDAITKMMIIGLSVDKTPPKIRKYKIFPIKLKRVLGKFTKAV